MTTGLSAAGAPGTVSREIRATDIDPRLRHQTILAAIDALTPGETMRLGVDHDPKPLYYLLQAERSGMIDWRPERQGPDEWVILLERTRA
jgi:uncharacterized protein (DUF2249 family)